MRRGVFLFINLLLEDLISQFPLGESRRRGRLIQTLTHPQGVWSSGGLRRVNFTYHLSDPTT